MRHSIPIAAQTPWDCNLRTSLSRIFKNEDVLFNPYNLTRDNKHVLMCIQLNIPPNNGL